MKNRHLTAGIVILFLIFSGLPTAVYAQNEADPSADYLTANPDDCHYGTSVNITGGVVNLGISYIVMDDAHVTTGDEVIYNFNVSTSITGFIIKLRMRSSSNGDLVTANVWVDSYSVGVLTSSSNTFDWKSTTFSGLALNGPHTLHIRFVGTQNFANLHIDKVQVTNMLGNNLYLDQAENYDGGGSSVDTVEPVVLAYFYDDASPVGTPQPVSDDSAETESGTTYYLSGGGSAVAQETWTAENPQDHTLSMEVVSTIDADLGNNMEYDIVSVYATLDISIAPDPHDVGTTDPVPGSHNYYGTIESIDAIPDPSCEFYYWKIDDTLSSIINPIDVEMEEDHTLKAYFLDPSIVPIFNTVGLIVLIASLIVTAGFLIRRRTAEKA